MWNYTSALSTTNTGKQKIGEFLHFTNNACESNNRTLNSYLMNGKNLSVEKFNEIINLISTMYH